LWEGKGRVRGDAGPLFHPHKNKGKVQLAVVDPGIDGGVSSSLPLLPPLSLLLCTVTSLEVPYPAP